MVVFASPHWFLLLPALFLVGWFWRGLKLWSPLRLAAILLLVATLSDPQINRTERGMDLWVLVDRSESARALTDKGLPEWRRLLERSRPSRWDRLRWMNFAGEVVEQAGPETLSEAGDPNYTRTRLALETVAASVRPKRHSRVLLFTDGYATEPLGDITRKLSETGLGIDYRVLKAPREDDFQVTDFQLPSRKRLGEPFTIEIEVAGTSDGEVEVVVGREGGEPFSRTVELVDGKGSLKFATRLVEPGAHRYTVELPVEDAYRGNNFFEGWIEIEAGPQIVLLSRYVDDPLLRILRAQGFSVELISDPLQATPGKLSGAKVLILNNVAAFELSGDFLRSIDFFVRKQGGGLLMAGGERSFGAGGYFESEVDELLPVSMELKEEHRKLAVAMSIVMDRSGSMSMTVAGGKTKMALANEGAARAVELLGAFDQVVVHAVDSTAHEEVPLLPVGQNRGRIINRVRRIGSMGGGIFVYTGLKAGWAELKKAPVGQRHIILFSDAADSEEPGDYVDLLDEVTRNGGTVSVIGLGTNADADAAFLQDIAKRGGGRIFFTDDPARVPNIFAQETVAVARSLFIKEPVDAASTGGWVEVSSDALDWPGAVDGYNLSYLRPGASVALLSEDEYEAPLVAFIRKGIGRSAAVAFPLGGEYSGSVRAWPGMADFVQTLTRWLMGETIPSGLGLRTRLDGTELSIDLLHDESWTERLSVAPRIFLEDMKGLGEERITEIMWERIAPGHFQAKAPLEFARPARGAIQVGDTALSFGPVVVGGSPEWSFDPSRVDELRQVAARTGGEELVKLEDAWKRPEREIYGSIQPWLLVALLGVILGDALVTRMGWRLPEWSPSVPATGSRKVKAKEAARREVRATDSQETEAAEKPAKRDETPSQEAGAQRSRFTRAKRRK